MNGAMSAQPIWIVRDNRDNKEQTAETTRTGPSWFGCGCSKLGVSCSQLWLLVAHLGVKKPD
jgi:hypothetical protein